MTQVLTPELFQPEPIPEKTARNPRVSSPVFIPQIIIWLDTLGNPHAETAGKNGHREKVELPANWAENNSQIMSALRAQIPPVRAGHNTCRLASEVKTTPTETPYEKSVREFNEKLAKMGEAERAAFLAERDRKLNENKEKLEEMSLSVAKIGQYERKRHRAIWDTSASTAGQGREFAQKTIGHRNPKYPSVEDLL